MSRFIKLVEVVRNNWKKSILGVAVFSYGGSYGIEYYQTNLLMRVYCKEAVKFGDEPLPPTEKPRHITVILNPVAKKRGSKKLFEMYCEPLLHLAGISVTIIQTKQEGQARTLIENFNTPTDGILVAGGDGTLLDVVTGLMRKYNDNLSHAKQCPIGILPLGETNRLADSLFQNSSIENLPQVRKMANATMAVVRGATKFADVIKIDPLEADIENPIKAIYAMGAIELGAWRDAQAKTDEYWYWGSLRKYVTYIFNGFKSDLNWNYSGTIKYSDPCKGCSQCYNNQLNENISSDRRWWQVFIPKRKVHGYSEIDYSKVKNAKCGKYNEMPVSAVEISLTTRNVKNAVDDTPAVRVNLGPESVSYRDFVTEGWRRLKGERNFVKDSLEIKDMELHPNITEKSSTKQQFFSIDNEEFELKPIKIKLLPNAVKMFCLQ